MTQKLKRYTTAQAIIEFLNKQYIEIDGKESLFVEGFFSIFGHGNVLGLGQALQENPGHLKSYQGKNEQGMAHAATAFARQNLRRKIFAITTSSGPGSANLVTAAGTAYANNIPLLLFPADMFASRQPDPVLQQIENEYSPSFSTNEALQAVSKFWDRINRPEQIMSSLIRGFEVLTNPSKTGPVTICLPQDIEAMAYDFPEEFFKKRVHHIKRLQPDNYEIQRAVKIIKKSKKPVLVVGGGAKYSEASEEVKKFSVRFNIPIVETHAGKSTIASDFELNLGGLGVLGTSVANKAVHQADLIIGLGTKFTDFTTSSKSIFNNQAQFLNININRMQAYKFDGLQIVADAKAAMEVINNKIDDYTSEFTNLIELKEDWQNERTRLEYIKFDENKIDPEIKNQFTQAKLQKYSQILKTEYSQTNALININNFIDDDAIIVAAAGSIPGDVQRIWQTDIFNTYHMEYGYSTMGYEIAGALGIKLAAKHQEVYALVGDGSFLMLHSELLTSLQYDKKINIIVFDNSGFGSINNLQMSSGSESFGTEFINSKENPINVDYKKIAEGYGLKSFSVNDKDSLLNALKEAKEQNSSTLIEVKVLPKTMTSGYDFSWWHIGLSEVSNNAKVEEAYKKQKERLKQARLY